MELGSAKYGNESVKKNYWKLKDGAQTYRILPPMGELAAKGRWNTYYAVHFGYKNANGQMRVFTSPEMKNRKTNQIEVPDAALDRIKSAQTALADAKSRGDENTAKVLAEFLDSYNIDKKYYMNVINLEGQIGILAIPHKAKLALDDAIDKLRAKGVDPLSVDNGRFFTFNRSGMNRDTIHQVSVYQEEREVPGMGKANFEKVHALTSEIIARLGNEAGQLNKLYPTPTGDQVAAIVKADIAKDYTQLDTLLGIKPRENSEGGNKGTGTAPASTGSSSASGMSGAASSSSAGLNVLTTNTPPTTGSVLPSSQPTSSSPTMNTVSTSSPTPSMPVASSKQSQEEFLKSIGALN